MKTPPHPKMAEVTFIFAMIKISKTNIFGIFFSEKKAEIFSFLGEVFRTGNNMYLIQLRIFGKKKVMSMNDELLMGTRSIIVIFDI